MDESFVTRGECARDDFVRVPLRLHASGGHLQAGGVSPLSFAYFSLRRQRKVGAAPHRGNANKPIRKQRKANPISTRKQAQNRQKPRASRRQKIFPHFILRQEKPA